MNHLLTQPGSLHVVSETARELTQLIVRTHPRDLNRTRLADARLLLESLPLATDDFAVARQRLQNADRYVRSSEWGAARYELRLLEGLVRQCLK